MAVSPDHLRKMRSSDLIEMISIEKRLDKYLATKYNLGSRLFITKSDLGKNVPVIDTVLANYKNVGWDIDERLDSDPVLVFSYANYDKE